MDKSKKWRMLILPALAVLSLADTAWAAGPGKPPVAGIAALMLMGVGITAFMTWGRATYPGLARRADRAVGSGAWRTFWVGLVNIIAAFLVVAFVGRLGPPAAPIVGLIVLGTVLVLAFRGGLGIWPDYGHRILGDEVPSDLKATLAGGALLTAALGLFPIGLAFFLYIAVRSLGAGVLMLVEEKKKDKEDDKAEAAAT